LTVVRIIIINITIDDDGFVVDVVFVGGGCVFFVLLFSNNFPPSPLVDVNSSSDVKINIWFCFISL